MSSPAEIYESFMVPSLFGPAASHMLRLAQPQPRERVLDLACGTGIIAREVASHVGPQGHVVGLDLNPDMLAVAGTVAEREELEITWQECRAEQTPFPDGSFDLVLCQHGLQFMPDRRQVLNEAHRVLANDGRMVLSVWRTFEHNPFPKALDDAVFRHIGVPTIKAAFSLGDENELRTLLSDAGFREIVIEPASIRSRFPDPDRYVDLQVQAAAAAVPAMQQMDAGARDQLTTAIRDDMKVPVSEHTEDGHLVIPFQAHVVLARC